MEAITKEKKVTRATIKKFVARELANNNLYISVKSTFDGMVDCVMPVNSAFEKAKMSTYGQNDNTLGVKGIWLVGNSRDSFTRYADDTFVGYEIYNCCGSFLVVMARHPEYIHAMTDFNSRFSSDHY